ncbi:MAG: zf-HC2 domain-containing protein [Candidatus Aminicenantes bacterium]|nr:zf-HC2 domain-containing protein [Candidatus Aminicenantes bacterium]
MKCSKAKKLISEYVDGELDDKQSRMLEEHLDKCPECSRLLVDFQKIVEDAENLDPYSPSEYAWENIKSRLTGGLSTFPAEEPQGRRKMNLLFGSPALKFGLSAAAVLIVVAAAFFFGLNVNRNGDFLPPDKAQEKALAKLEEAEYHYRKAIDALMEAVSSPENVVSPEMAAVFRANLEVINLSITGYKGAVLMDPSDIESRNALITAYAEKVTFLNKMLTMSKKTSYAQEELTTL